MEQGTAPIEGVRFPCKVYSAENKLLGIISPEEQKKALNDPIEADHLRNYKIKN